MNILSLIKKAFEKDKCEFCGGDAGLIHEMSCFESVLGYNRYEGNTPEEKVYMMRMKGLIK